jgi:hypothetical protein
VSSGAAPPPRGVQRYGTITVVGGGCYGSYYVRQLGRAFRAGAATWRRLLVVDRDGSCRVSRESPALTAGTPGVEIISAEWSEYFAGYLGGAAANPEDAASDTIVPSPLMPHLLYDWLASRARGRWESRSVTSAPVDAPVGVPWERIAPDGTRYVSFADWTCPINCVEPATCPHTRAPRDWSLPVAIARYAGAQSAVAGPAAGATLHCTHRVYGVGMIDVREVVDADRLIGALGDRGPVDILIGTVSHCHGALSRLQVSAPPAAGTEQG